MIDNVDSELAKQIDEDSYRYCDYDVSFFKKDLQIFVDKYYWQTASFSFPLFEFTYRFAWLIYNLIIMN